MMNNVVVKVGIGNFIRTFFLKEVGFLTIPVFTRMFTTAEYGYVSICFTCNIEDMLFIRIKHLNQVYLFFSEIMKRELQNEK